MNVVLFMAGIALIFGLADIKRGFVTAVAFCLPMFALQGKGGIDLVPEVAGFEAFFRVAGFTFFAKSAFVPFFPIIRLVAGITLARQLFAHLRILVAGRAFGISMFVFERKKCVPVMIKAAIFPALLAVTFFAFVA